MPILRLAFLISGNYVRGIVSGSVYAIVAVGMTMIFGVLRAINFAHGEYYMLGTFGAWFAIERIWRHGSRLSVRRRRVRTGVRLGQAGCTIEDPLFSSVLFVWRLFRHPRLGRALSAGRATSRTHPAEPRLITQTRKRQRSWNYNMTGERKRFVLRQLTVYLILARRSCVGDKIEKSTDRQHLGIHEKRREIACERRPLPLLDCGSSAGSSMSASSRSGGIAVCRSANVAAIARANLNESDWTMLRDCWERSHLHGAATSVSALILLAVALRCEKIHAFLRLVRRAPTAS